MRLNSHARKGREASLGVVRTDIIYALKQRHRVTLDFEMKKYNITKDVHFASGDENIESLKSCLKTWTEMMCDRDGWGWNGEDGNLIRDAPWWYNERASVSHFAGAIWKNGGWVTEEFVVSREGRGGPNYRIINIHGRCDISFEVKNLKIIAEAKQVWPSLTGSERATAVISKALKKAENEVKQRPASNGYERYAIVFASPYVTPDADTKTEVNNFIEAILKIKDAHAVAWAFPLIENPIQSPRPRYENRYFPGVALVISRVQ